MNQNQIEKLLMHYLQSTDHDLSSADQATLTDDVKQMVLDLESDASASDVILDDRAIDSMLRFNSLSQSDHDVFVQRCIANFEKALVNNAESVNSKMGDPNVADSTSQPKVKISTRPNQRKPRRQTKSVIGLIVIAACLVLPLVGAWMLTGALSTDQSTGAQSSDSKIKPDSSALDSAFTDFKSKSTDNDPLDGTVTPNSEIGNHLFDNIVIRRPPRPVDAVRPRSNEGAVAKLVATSDAIWESSPMDRSIAAGRWNLRSGTAILEFEDGTKIELHGPVSIQLRSPTEIFVENGKVLAEIAPGNDEFLVRSNAVDVVKPASAHFQLGIDDAGSAELYVYRGHVEMLNRHIGDGKAWRLNSDQLNQAVVSGQPAAETVSPNICMVRGNDDFRGTIELDGKSVATRSPEIFGNLVDQINQAKSSSPDFREKWHDFVERMQTGKFRGSFENGGNRHTFDSLDQMFEAFQERNKKMRDKDRDSATGFQGNFNFNGQQHEFNSMQEFLEFQSKMFGPMLQMPGLIHGENNSAFSGVININGREMRFTDPQEFKKAMR